MKKKIFSMLVLLMTAVTGAWADNYLVDTYTITATVLSQSANLSETATLPYESTLAGCYEAATGSAPMAALTVNSVSVSSGDNVTLGELDGWNTTLSVTGVGSATIAVTLNMGSANVTINCVKNASADPTPSVVEVTPTGNKNEWEFTMPDYAVVAKIEYDTELALNEVDDNAAILDEWDGYEADVTLTRALVKNTWNTFAAPFDISAEKIAEINALLVQTGGSLTIKELESSTLSGNTLTLNFKDAESIEAGKPYLVKLPGNLSLAKLPFEGVEVSKEPVPVTTDFADFIPTLGKTLVTGPEGDKDNKDAVLFVAAGNTLKTPTVVNDTEDASSYMKGFRGYFQLHDAAEARTFALNLGDESTGVVAIDNGQLIMDNSAYDLQGRKLQGQPTKKGVYIVNGKKTIK